MWYVVSHINPLWKKSKHTVISSVWILSRVYFFLLNLKHKWPVLAHPAYTSALHIALIHQYGVWRPFIHAAADPSDRSCCRQSPLYQYTHSTCPGCTVEQKTAINLEEKPKSQFNTGGLGFGKPQADFVSQEDFGSRFDTG